MTNQKVIKEADPEQPKQPQKFPWWLVVIPAIIVGVLITLGVNTAKERYDKLKSYEEVEQSIQTIQNTIVHIENISLDCDTDTYFTFNDKGEHMVAIHTQETRPNPCNDGSIISDIKHNKSVVDAYPGVFQLPKN